MQVTKNCTDCGKDLHNHITMQKNTNTKYLYDVVDAGYICKNCFDNSTQDWKTCSSCDEADIEENMSIGWDDSLYCENCYD